jgi:hypothetical protein
MRISIQSGSNETIICGGETKGQYPENLTINGRRTVQVAEFIRSATAKPYNRGNRRTTVSFQLTVQNTDGMDAGGLLWKTSEDLLTAAAALPTSGTVVFLCEGSGRKAYRLLDAVIESDDAQQIGLTIVTRYTIIGGRFEVLP